MFPQCANSECSASFASFREGSFFRFRRTDPAHAVPAKSHAVEHAWLCAQCSERYTLDYQENKTILVSIAPARPPIELIEVPSPSLPMRKRTRANRRHRPSSRRASAQPAANSPLVVLAITPRTDFIDRT